MAGVPRRMARVLVVLFSSLNKAYLLHVIFSARKACDNGRVLSSIQPLSPVHRSTYCTDLIAGRGPALGCGLDRRKQPPPLTLCRPCSRRRMQDEALCSRGPPVGQKPRPVEAAPKRVHRFGHYSATQKRNETADNSLLNHVLSTTPGLCTSATNS